MEINLKLTVEQINFILAKLGTQPFNDVAQIMTIIQQQAQAQVAQAQPAANTAANESVN